MPVDLVVFTAHGTKSSVATITVNGIFYISGIEERLQCYFIEFESGSHRSIHARIISVGRYIEVIIWIKNSIIGKLRCVINFHITVKYFKSAT